MGKGDCHLSYALSNLLWMDLSQLVHSITLFHTLHHLLQQWTEAEEEDCRNSCHDSKECEEVCEVGDLIAKE